MVSLWGIPIYWLILPEWWMVAMAVVLCLGFDLYVASNAADLQLTKDSIQSKFLEDDKLFYMTKNEMWLRLAWLAVGGVLLYVFSNDWFVYDEQQSKTVSRFVVHTVTILAVAYISAIYVPLRAMNELKAGAEPFFVFDPRQPPPLSKHGWPFLLLAALIFTLIVMITLNPSSEETGSVWFIIFILELSYISVPLALIMMQASHLDFKIRAVCKDRWEYPDYEEYRKHKLWLVAFAIIEVIAYFIIEIIKRM